MSTKNWAGGRKVTPPRPAYMTDEQLAQYLKDLRNNRPPRPNGSRPLPPKAGSRLSLSGQEGLQADHDDPVPRAASALSTTRNGFSDHQNSRLNHQPDEASFPRASSALSHRRIDSQASLRTQSSRRAPDRESNDSPGPHISRVLSPAPTVMSSASRRSGHYRESGQRWMEKQEARSLRDALEEMDLHDNEEQLHVAAQEEATQLVLEHQEHGLPAKDQPQAPFKNPDTTRASRFLSHLDEGSHARSQSLAGSVEANSGMPQGGLSYRSVSGSSNGSLHGTEVRGPSASSLTEKGRPMDTSVKRNGSLRRKQKVNFALPEEEEVIPVKPIDRRSRRTISNDSSKGIFRNPQDYIYEEPEDPDDRDRASAEDNSQKPGAVLTEKPRNSVSPTPGVHSHRVGNVPPPSGSSLKQRETHRNQSKQVHDPVYKSNKYDSISKKDEEEAAPTKDGIEIRSDEMRAATSRKFKDRSANLPNPSAVSDRPGRPIVSFDPNWQPPKNESSDSQPSIQLTAADTGKQSAPEPAVPEISVSSHGDHANPSISVSAPPTAKCAEDPPKNKTSTRALPTPGRSSDGASRRRRHHNKDTSIEIRGHASLRSQLPTASCAACGLPISGRIVTASNSRLHPECFTCYHCSTGLECVAFYEEPTAKREERLAAGDTAEEEEPIPRFYCHLDFHELFSPRCKHCKTPIESEVIVACGAEWHEGHFFCAECGDPFTSTTPFVEDAGYAWCVRCHSRRTASKCRGCKLPVLEDVVITALDGQWHEKCFVCHECGGGFGPEGRFFVREGQPRVTAKGRQIGGPVQHAVCEACESRRLRA